MRRMRLRFVACGQPLPGHEIRIVGCRPAELGEREEGPPAIPRSVRHQRLFPQPGADTPNCSTASGWTPAISPMSPAATSYLTGRIKDIIIRAGRNIYPYELEEAVGDIPGIRKGCVAVFGSPRRPPPAPNAW